MPDPDPWDYEGNRENANGDLRCPGCPFGDDSPGLACFYGVFQQPACQVIHARQLNYLFDLVKYRTLNPPMIPGGGESISVGLSPDQQTATALATLASIKEVKRCEYRTNPETGCQAGCATCVRPDRPGKVTMRDCLACLDASPA